MSNHDIWNHVTLATQEGPTGKAAENAARECCPTCGSEYSLRKSSRSESVMHRYCRACNYRRHHGGWKKKISKPLFGL